MAIWHTNPLPILQQWEKRGLTIVFPLKIRFPQSTLHSRALSLLQLIVKEMFFVQQLQKLDREEIRPCAIPWGYLFRIECLRDHRSGDEGGLCRTVKNYAQQLRYQIASSYASQRQVCLYHKAELIRQRMQL